MYFSNMTHFLDESGNIPKEMPKEGRQMAAFLALAIDTTTQNQVLSGNLRCFQKNCNGLILSHLSPDRKVIEWKCQDCGTEGRISDWQGTKWDNLK